MLCERVDTCQLTLSQLITRAAIAINIDALMRQGASDRAGAARVGEDIGGLTPQCGGRDPKGCTKLRLEFGLSVGITPPEFPGLIVLYLARFERRRRGWGCQKFVWRVLRGLAHTWCVRVRCCSCTVHEALTNLCAVLVTAHMAAAAMRYRRCWKFGAIESGTSGVMTAVSSTKVRQGGWRSVLAFRRPVYRSNDSSTRKFVDVLAAAASR